jgi:hypothetical protein
MMHAAGRNRLAGLDSEMLFCTVSSFPPTNTFHLGCDSNTDQAHGTPIRILTRTRTRETFEANRSANVRPPQFTSICRLSPALLVVNPSICYLKQPVEISHNYPVMFTTGRNEACCRSEDQVTALAYSYPNERNLCKIVGVKPVHFS